MFKRGYGDRWRDSGFDCPPQLMPLFIISLFLFGLCDTPIANFFFIVG